ncbi:MAG: sugar-binding protein [Spirochaetota bacterium]
MKKFLALLGAIASLSFAETVTDTLIDFPAGYKANPAYKQDPVTASSAETSADMKRSGERSLKISYTHEKAAYAEYVLAPFTGGNAIEDIGGELTLAGFASAEGIWIKLRLIDAKGETFQSRGLTLKKGTWETKKIRLADGSADIESSWGGNNDKKLDVPVKFHTIIVEGSGSGTIYFDRITHTYTEKEAPAGGEVIAADFENASGRIEPLAKVKIKSENAEITDATAIGKRSLGVTISIDGRGYAEYPIIDFTKDVKITERGGSVSLCAKSTSKDMWVKIRLQDATGETFQSTRLNLGGDQWLTKTVRVIESKDEFEFPTWGGNKDGKFDFPITIHRLIIEGAGDAVVYIDNIIYADANQSDYLASLRKTGMFSVVNDRPINIFEQGAECAFTLMYSNKTRKSADVVLSARIADYFGTPVIAKKKTVHFEAREAKTLPLTMGTANKGYFAIELLAATTTGHTISEGTVSFGIVSGKNTARAKPGDFIYAMCAHPGGSQLDTGHVYYQWLDYLGVDMLRWDFTWGGVEPKQGQWNYNNLDTLVANHLGVKVTPLPILDYFAGWFSKDGRTPPSDLSLYYVYATNTVTRYKDRLKYWEVWNEADWGFWPGDFSRYIELYKETYTRIKDIDPALKVMNSGWAFANRPSRGLTETSYDRMDRFYAAIGKNIDVYAYHAHGNVNELYIEKFPKIREHLKKIDKSGIEIWDNESGYTVVGGQTERDQAEMLVKKISTVQAEGHHAYFWYDLFCDGPDPKEGEHNFGIIRYNDRAYHEPRPGYLAYHALLRTMRGFRFRTIADVGEGIMAHLYENDTAALAVLWLNENASRLTYLNIGEAADASQIDIMGNERPVSVREGKAAVTITKTPSYLRWNKSGPVVMKGGPMVIAMPRSITVIPGSSTAVPVSVQNPFGKPITGSLSVAAGGTFAGAIVPKERDITLAASEQKKIDFTVSSPARGSSKDMLSARLTVDNEMIGFAAVAIRYAVPITAKGDYRPGSPQWPSAQVFAELKELKDIFNLFAFDPTRKELHWRDADDQSAAVRIACDDAKLYLQITVKDDIHFQNEPMDRLWNADSVQFAVSKDSESDSMLYDVGLSDGKVLMIKRAPGDKVVPIADGEIAAEVKRDDAGKRTVYEIALVRAGLPASMAFNCIVNDNDGKGRKGWLWIAEGLGNARDPRLWPIIVLK